MEPRLIVAATDATVAGSAWDRRVEGEELIAGRDPGADLVLEDLSVSLQHFRIAQEETGWKLHDEDSRHGTP